MVTWVYINSETNLWTVGFYDPTGKWQSESDHPTPADAAQRVHWLNGAECAKPRGEQLGISWDPRPSGTLV